MYASSAVFLLAQIPNFLLTRIPRISQDCFVDGESHGGWENGCVGGCQITPRVLITPITPSAPITKAHTDPTRFNKNNLW